MTFSCQIQYWLSLKVASKAGHILRNLYLYSRRYNVYAQLFSSSVLTPNTMNTAHPTKATRGGHRHSPLWIAISHPVHLYSGSTLDNPLPPCMHAQGCNATSIDWSKQGDLQIRYLFQVKMGWRITKGEHSRPTLWPYFSLERKIERIFSECY